jgi:hypothetical protein
MSNAMMQLHLYKRGDTWKFDDPMHGIKAEPFVLGMSEMISFYVANSRVYTTTITFSLSKFPRCHELNFLEHDSNGAWYFDPYSEKMGWLCPIIRTYMNGIPQKIYFTIEQKEKKSALKSIFKKIKLMWK